MHFKVTNALLLKKRYEYIIVLKRIFSDLNVSTDELTASIRNRLPVVSNITNTLGTKFKIVSLDLTYDDDDNDVNEPILSVNINAATNSIQTPNPDEKYYDVIIPPDVRLQSHNSAESARDALIGYCASVGYSAQRSKIKGMYHLYGCEYGNLTRGTRRNTTRNTCGKNRNCPWR